MNPSNNYNPIQPLANVESETTVLGAILLNNDLYRAEARHLTLNCFSLDSHRRIFSTLTMLLEDGKPVDTGILAAHLGEQLEIIGGSAYLSSLTDRVAKRTTIEYHVQLLQQNAARRRFARALEDFTVRAKAGTNDVGVMLADATTAISEIAESAFLSNTWQTLFHPYDEIANVKPQSSPSRISSQKTA